MRKMDHPTHTKMVSALALKTHRHTHARANTHTRWMDPVPTQRGGVAAAAAAIAVCILSQCGRAVLDLPVRFLRQTEGQLVVATLLLQLLPVLYVLLRFLFQLCLSRW